MAGRGGQGKPWPGQRPEPSDSDSETETESDADEGQDGAQPRRLPPPPNIRFPTVRPSTVGAVLLGRSRSTSQTPTRRDRSRSPSRAEAAAAAAAAPPAAPSARASGSRGASPIKTRLRSARPRPDGAAAPAAADSAVASGQQQTDSTRTARASGSRGPSPIKFRLRSARPRPDGAAAPAAADSAVASGQQQTDSTRTARASGSRGPSPIKIRLRSARPRPDGAAAPAAADSAVASGQQQTDSTRTARASGSRGPSPIPTRPRSARKLSEESRAAAAAPAPAGASSQQQSAAGAPAAESVQGSGAGSTSRPQSRVKNRPPKSDPPAAPAPADGSTQQPRYQTRSQARARDQTPARGTAASGPSSKRDPPASSGRVSTAPSTQRAAPAPAPAPVQSQQARGRQPKSPARGGSPGQSSSPKSAVAVPRGGSPKGGAAAAAADGEDTDMLNFGSADLEENLPQDALYFLPSLDHLPLFVSEEPPPFQDFRLTAQDVAIALDGALIQNRVKGTPAASPRPDGVPARATWLDSVLTHAQTQAALSPQPVAPQIMSPPRAGGGADGAPVLPIGLQPMPLQVRSPDGTIVTPSMAGSPSRVSSPLASTAAGSHGTSNFPSPGGLPSRVSSPPASTAGGSHGTSNFPSPGGSPGRVSSPPASTAGGSPGILKFPSPGGSPSRVSSPPASTAGGSPGILKFPSPVGSPGPVSTPLAITAGGADDVADMDEDFDEEFKLSEKDLTDALSYADDLDNLDPLIMHALRQAGHPAPGSPGWEEFLKSRGLQRKARKPDTWQAQDAVALASGDAGGTALPASTDGRALDSGDAGGDDAQAMTVVAGPASGDGALTVEGALGFRTPYHHVGADRPPGLHPTEAHMVQMIDWMRYLVAMQRQPQHFLHAENGLRLGRIVQAFNRSWMYSVDRLQLIPADSDLDRARRLRRTVRYEMNGIQDEYREGLVDEYEQEMSGWISYLRQLRRSNLQYSNEESRVSFAAVAEAFNEEFDQTVRALLGEEDAENILNVQGGTADLDLSPPRADPARSPLRTHLMESLLAAASPPKGHLSPKLASPPPTVEAQDSRPGSAKRKRGPSLESESDKPAAKVPAQGSPGGGDGPLPGSPGGSRVASPAGSPGGGGSPVRGASPARGASPDGGSPLRVASPVTSPVGGATPVRGASPVGSTGGGGSPVRGASPDGGSPLRPASPVQSPVGGASPLRVASPVGSPGGVPGGVSPPRGASPVGIPAGAASPGPGGGSPVRGASPDGGSPLRPASPVQGPVGGASPLRVASPVGSPGGVPGGVSPPRGASPVGIPAGAASPGPGGSPGGSSPLSWASPFVGRRGIPAGAASPGPGGSPGGSSPLSWASPFVGRGGGASSGPGGSPGGGSGGSSHPGAGPAGGGSPGAPNPDGGGGGGGGSPPPAGSPGAPSSPGSSGDEVYDEDALFNGLMLHMKMDEWTRYLCIMRHRPQRLSQEETATTLANLLNLVHTKLSPIAATLVRYFPTVNPEVDMGTVALLPSLISHRNHIIRAALLSAGFQQGISVAALEAIDQNTISAWTQEIDSVADPFPAIDSKNQQRFVITYHGFYDEIADVVDQILGGRGEFLKEAEPIRREIFQTPQLHDQVDLPELLQVGGDHPVLNDEWQAPLTTKHITTRRVGNFPSLPDTYIVADVDPSDVSHPACESQVEPLYRQRAIVNLFDVNADRFALAKTSDNLRDIHGGRLTKNIAVPQAISAQALTDEAQYHVWALKELKRLQLEVCLSVMGTPKYTHMPTSLQNDVRFYIIAYHKFIRGLVDHCDHECSRVLEPQQCCYNRKLAPLNAIMDREKLHKKTMHKFVIDITNVVTKWLNKTGSHCVKLPFHVMEKIRKWNRDHQGKPYPKGDEWGPLVASTGMQNNQLKWIFRRLRLETVAERGLERARELVIVQELDAIGQAPKDQPLKPAVEAFLTGWMEAHREYPYPIRSEKETLRKYARLTSRRIQTWLSDYRRKHDLAGTWIMRDANLLERQGNGRGMDPRYGKVGAPIADPHIDWDRDDSSTSEDDSGSPRDPAAGGGAGGDAGGIAAAAAGGGAGGIAAAAAAGGGAGGIAAAAAAAGGEAGGGGEDYADNMLIDVDDNERPFPQAEQYGVTTTIDPATLQEAFSNAMQEVPMVIDGGDAAGLPVIDKAADADLGLGPAIHEAIEKAAQERPIGDQPRRDNDYEAYAQANLPGETFVILDGQFVPAVGENAPEDGREVVLSNVGAGGGGGADAQAAIVADPGRAPDPILPGVDPHAQPQPGPIVVQLVRSPLLQARHEIQQMDAQGQLPAAIADEALANLQNQEAEPPPPSPQQPVILDPILQAAPPAAGHPQPHAGSPPPDGGHPQPHAGSPPPDGGHPQPHAGSPPPAAGHPQPHAGSPPPAAGYPQPHAGSPPPAAGSPPPAAGHPQPHAGSPPPAAGHPQPHAGSPPPAAGHPQPHAGSPPPAAGHPQPHAGSPPPAAGHPQPPAGAPQAQAGPAPARQVDDRLPDQGPFDMERRRRLRMECWEPNARMATDLMFRASEMIKACVSKVNAQTILAARTGTITRLVLSHQGFAKSQPVHTWDDCVPGPVNECCYSLRYGEIDNIVGEQQRLAASLFMFDVEVFRLVGIASNIQKGKCNRVMRLNMPGWVVRWMDEWCAANVAVHPLTGKQMLAAIEAEIGLTYVHAISFIYKWKAECLNVKVIPAITMGQMEEAQRTYMRNWFEEHVQLPHPTNAELDVMCRETGLSAIKVLRWLDNYRLTNNFRMTGIDGHGRSMFRPIQPGDEAAIERITKRLLLIR
ncbi:protein MpBELL3 [Marchantia polymorpha subsp. ruderalis]